MPVPKVETIGSARKPRRLRNSTAKVLVALGAATLVLLLLPKAAVAALDIGISGSVYSSASAWYESSNARYVTNDRNSAIDLQLDRRPLDSNGNEIQPLIWQIHYFQYGTHYYSLETFVYSSSWHWDIAPYANVGDLFYNRYKRYWTCNNCNHDFWGNMNY